MHIQAKLGQENLLRMVRWVRWHCPPDTGFEIQTLKVWGGARYLSVTVRLSFTSGWERNIFISFQPPRPRNKPQTVAWKAAVLTTTLGPRPSHQWTCTNSKFGKTSSLSNFFRLCRHIFKINIFPFQSRSSNSRCSIWQIHWKTIH